MMALTVIIGTIAGLLFAGMLIQAVLCHFERNKMKHNTYGQLVSVNGKHMNVEIIGDGEEVIVLLPGRGVVPPHTRIQKSGRYAGSVFYGSYC